MAFQVKKNDVLIPVMGSTGAGKSYFINNVLNHPRMPVGSDLDSCTTELAFGCIEGIPSLKNQRIILIDTPGFDNTDKDDHEILEKLASWLRQSYKEGAKIGGVIYLHDITNDRFNGTARRNLKMFQDLCGDAALKNVVFATTKWSRKTQDSVNHQHQLETKHWKPLIDKGATVHRLDQGFATVETVIGTIINALKSNTFQTSTETKPKSAENKRNPFKGLFQSKRWWAFST